MINRRYYPKEVRRLLDHGKIEGNPFVPNEWFDYVGRYKLGEMDVPPLIDLAHELRHFDRKKPKEFYAPLHAVRALGQLGDMAADEALILLLENYNDDDLVENTVMALTMVGDQAMTKLMTYADKSLTQGESRGRAAEAFYWYARRHPQHKQTCIGYLMRLLTHYHRQSPESNGIIVMHLVELKATEAMETIVRVFEAEALNDEITGSLAAVRVGLGLADEADFTPDELLGERDKAFMREQQEEKKAAAKETADRLTNLSGSYSITDHLR